MEQLKAGDPAAVGPYRITARLGAGGMGQVYLGESRSGRRVAVKVVRPEIASDPGFRARFRREVEAAKAVGGFWTATVVDADPEAETPWVASDYIPAPNLAELVRDRGPLTEDAVWRLGAGLAEALHSVHRAGLVHRDLKPANVLLTENGPRLIDFGIAKALNGATMLTRTGVAIGTAGFMSPEQAQGGSVGTASDIFSLGTVLCFAATGRMPFGQGSAAELLYRVVHEVPNLDRVPDGLRTVLGDCLEKRAERRPSAEEVLSALSGGGAVTVAPSATDADADAGVRPPAAPPDLPFAPPPRALGRPGPPAVPVAAPVPTFADRRSGPPVEVRYSMGHMRVAVGAMLAGAVPLGAAVYYFVGHPLPAALASIVALALFSLGGLAMARGDAACVRVAGDGLSFLREGHEWSATWEELSRVTLKATRWGLLQEFVVVGELAPGATKNVVWERFQPVGPGHRAAVTTIRFRDERRARAEVGRLHEALLHCAGERYSYDGGLFSVVRSR
ncbi:serine/threonine protein kinase [Streptomyces sp. NBC_00190]|uniref:serine/threonine-protein kinase n=1 Tax=unclassified Streptomyces TaxID=2593676 RepID=UPI002E2A72BC|nr:serine/threonine-protein kinase [Streptomyces sp. NBC_00190]WSZ38407.1 serine/threonine protein kinase [Streptomyces sp. NBC_00868]